MLSGTYGLSSLYVAVKEAFGMSVRQLMIAVLDRLSDPHEAHCRK
jgi:hypothetical protein